MGKKRALWTLLSPIRNAVVEAETNSFLHVLYHKTIFSSSWRFMGILVNTFPVDCKQD